MNKRPGGGNRRSELEKDLIGDIAETNARIETGKDRMTDKDPYMQRAMSDYRRFAIKQGVRRRHPDRVLAQFSQIAKETSNAESVWEKSLMHEQERTEIPEEYKADDGEMIASQTGLVTTALDNYVHSKGKFERTVLTGV